LIALAQAKEQGMRKRGVHEDRSKVILRKRREKSMYNATTMSTNELQSQKLEYSLPYHIFHLLYGIYMDDPFQRLELARSPKEKKTVNETSINHASPSRVNKH
jgi:hypothetical protein